MSQTVGQSTYYDFRELRKMARDLAVGRSRVSSKHMPAQIKGRLVRYSLRVTNNGASVVAHIELPNGLMAERAELL